MKKGFTFSFFVLWSFLLFAQPSNDDCIGLIDLGEAPICPYPDTFTNVDATLSQVFSNPSDNIPSCFTGGVIDRDVWFSFMVPASGAILDFEIRITGVDGPNGSIQQPQVAMYRGDCFLDELQELACATSLPGESEVELAIDGLTPGLTYFLRVSDWSATAAPNWGDFVVCVKEPDPIFNIGDEPSTDLCEGILFDSGGPNGDYSDGENFSFTVCPSAPTQCIEIEVEEFDIENGFDELTIYSGPSTNSLTLATIDGTGGGLQLFSQSECVTFQFTSDGSVTFSGFSLNWSCSPDSCDIPPPSTCTNTTMIPSLPYSMMGLSTCGAGNQLEVSPCGDNFWLGSEDMFFTYESPGNECISVSALGGNFGTGVAVYDACPDSPGANCIEQAQNGFFTADAVITAAFLELPGTYYIVVDNASFCTPFDLVVESIDCPVVFPSAALCEDALGLNGCDNLPAIVSVSDGQGDPNFLNANNDGCWGGGPFNYTWFFFQAQTDGEFAFVVAAANAAEASDLDFQVYGPIDNFNDACGFAFSNQPIRSSYAGGADPTGLAAIHPITGISVIDTCEDAGGDDFVAPIDVIEGEYYFILINDWGGAITSSAVAIDFGGTTPGVLNALPNIVSVSNDTTLCPGEDAQLLATGGEVYSWFPIEGLSCFTCPDPIASITEPTSYTVAITSVCSSDTLQVNVGFEEINAGPDIEICLGDTAFIVATSTFLDSLTTYSWDDPTGLLSCNDCLEPSFISTTSGVFEFVITATGTSCSDSDTMMVTVLESLETFDSIDICEGDSITVFGETVTEEGVFSETFTTSSGCDSVHTITVTVSPSPETSEEIEICQGESIEVFGMPVDTAGIFSATFTTGAGCDSIHTITVTVAPAPEVFEDIQICAGETIEVFGMPVDTAGVFTETFTTSAGCDSIHTVTVTVAPAPETFETIDICDNESIEIFGEVVTMAGVYSATFTTAEGCDSIHTVTLTVSPTSATSEDLFICFGESIEIFGEIVNTAGSYDMTFVGSNGCDSTHTVNLTVNEEIILDIEGTDLLCFGGNDGSATATATGGSGNFIYTWSNGMNGATIDGLEAGEYSVTATDESECSVVGSITIEQPTELVATVTGQDVGCDVLGSASVSAEGGTPDYAYEWSNGETTSEIVDLVAGNYSVTVMDENGCTTTGEIEISGALGPEVSISIDELPSESNPEGGALTATVDGGTSPFDVEWSNGDSTLSIDSLPSGVYEVTVTDANGCTATDDVYIFLPGCTGGKIWDDSNRDGCQSGGELGIGGIELELTGTDIFGNPISMTTTTAINGEYIFEPLPPGDYQVFLPVPNDLQLSPMDNCSDDFTDSDFDNNGLSFVVDLQEGHCCLIVDGGLYDECLNVSDPGKICCDQIICGPGVDPEPINSLAPATGAAGAVEYMWMYSHQSPSFSNGVWNGIPGTNSLSYDPGPLAQTTYFARCVRAVGCNEWLETNVVEIFVDDVAVAQIDGPNSVCLGNPATYTAADNGPGASYEWYFGPWASPQTASGQSVDVTWLQAGIVYINLKVTADGCTSTASFGLAISDSPVYCTGNMAAPGANITSPIGMDDTPHFSAFPNPVSDVLTVNWDSMIEGDVEVELLSLDGKRMMHNTAKGVDQNYQTDLSSFLPGMYLFRVKYGNGEQEVFRVVKH